MTANLMNLQIVKGRKVTIDQLLGIEEKGKRPRRKDFAAMTSGEKTEALAEVRRRRERVLARRNVEQTEPATAEVQEQERARDARGRYR
jgi:hypothetical protein